MKNRKIYPLALSEDKIAAIRKADRDLQKALQVARISGYTISGNYDAANLTLTLETKLIDLGRPKRRRPQATH